MGTRADFYVGRGKDAEWLGSIAWDGYPDGIDIDLVNATSEAEYRTQLASFFEKRDDVTKPDEGWPWPWDDSGTTDFAYAFFDGNVHASCFGHAFQIASQWNDEADEGSKEEVFPDMSSRKRVQVGAAKSGIIVVGG